MRSSLNQIEERQQNKARSSEILQNNMKSLMDLLKQGQERFGMRISQNASTNQEDCDFLEKAIDAVRKSDGCKHIRRDPSVVSMYSNNEEDEFKSIDTFIDPESLSKVDEEMNEMFSTLKLQCKETFIEERQDPSPDCTETLTELRAKAEKGDADAQFDLGTRYISVSEEEKDYKEAIFWYRKAARQNHVLAQSNLGVLLMAGKAGNGKNYSKAVYWYRRAARQGNCIAMYNLGAMFLHGLGVPLNRTIARKWFDSALEGAREIAKEGFPYTKEDCKYLYEMIEESVKSHLNEFEGNVSF